MGFGGYEGHYNVNVIYGDYVRGYIGSYRYNGQENGNYSLDTRIAQQCRHFRV